jgi:replicative DNA helicase
LPSFTRKIWGLKEGLTVVGARTSQGKSSFVAQIALDLADQGYPVLFLSLEMTVENILERLFCNIMRINNYDLMTGGFAKYQNEWQTFCKLIENTPLLITSGIGKSWQEVNVMIENMNPKPRCVIVDYIQAVSRKSNESRETLNEYIRYFREMSLNHKFIGILCSQINRQSATDKSREPSLWTLKETGVLEEHADMVLLLHWDYFYTLDQDENKQKEYKIIVAKSRNGRTGEFYVDFHPEYYLFKELSITNQEVAREAKEKDMYDE